jgi:hypothetical protein
VLLLVLSGAAQAQDERLEFWPEVDFWVRTSPRTSLFFPVAITRAAEVDYTEGLVGAHVDRRFSRAWSARVGYRYLWAISDQGEEDQYRESRFVLEATGRVYPGAGITVSDRNRIDLRFINGDFSWRYRNRVRVERAFGLGAERAVTPYTMVEVFFDSRYDDVTRLRWQLGTEYQFSDHVWVDGYYLRQWDDSAELTHVNAIGLALNLAWCNWCPHTPAPPRVEGGVN